jgi:hypothetical protein
MAFLLTLIGCNSSVKLDSRLVGSYKSIERPYRFLDIKADGSFEYKSESEGFKGGTHINAHTVKGQFQFGPLTYSQVEGFTDEYSQSITGFKYSNDHISNDGDLLFNQIKWGPEYMTSIGFTRREVTGPNPRKSILFITGLGGFPPFVKVK